MHSSQEEKDYLRSKKNIFSSDINSIWLLGRCYSVSCTDELAEFLNNWSSLIRFTYRQNFPQIPTTNITSDKGWGCTLRTAQMFLANALLLHFLGEGWTSRECEILTGIELYILEWFDDSISAPFSIHSISRTGIEYSKAISQWYGPNTVAKIIKKLCDSHKPFAHDLELHVADNGIIYRNRLFTNSMRCIIMVPLRLGIHEFNTVYTSMIQFLFRIPHFLGIIGGYPKLSYYFVGYQGDELLYLDPHSVQRYVNMRDRDGNNEEELKTFHTLLVEKMPIKNIDPSLTIGFYCRDVDDYNNLKVTIEKELKNNHLPSILAFEEFEPTYEEKSQAKLIQDDFIDLG